MRYEKNWCSARRVVCVDAGIGGECARPDHLDGGANHTSTWPPTCGWHHFSYRIVPVFICGWTSPNDQDRYFHSQGLTNRCYTPNLPLGAKRRFVLSHRLFTFKELFQKKRMLTKHVLVAICLLIVLSSQKATVTTTFWCTMVFWTYILIDFRRVHYRPHNPDTQTHKHRIFVRFFLG